ncbi:MBL fold metallo-hydrolase [Vibrio fluvialis]|nr:MBL fold metallo-hydrolase [Vibrio fluvialis]
MKLHTLKGYIQNIYLAEYPDKLLLLDGASRADVPVIQAFIEKTLERPVQDLKAVVVTHMHPDHAGGAHKLRELTGCKIVSANKTNHWYQGWDGVLMYLTDLALAHWMANRLRCPKRRLWFARKLRADIRLCDGDVIPGFEDWQVLETPGHTDRDLSVYHPQQGILYVADLIVEVKKRLISPFPIFYPNQYRRSVKRVLDLAPNTLLLAHGKDIPFDEAAYQHLIDTTPVRPATHWRATKLKAKSVMKSIWLFGFLERKNQL